MTEGDKALKSLLDRLHSAEIELELANALTPEDHRLNASEMLLHTTIGAIERIAQCPDPGEKWDCKIQGHQDSGGMFAFTCKHCDYSEH